MSIDRLEQVDDWLHFITKKLTGVVERPRREAFLLIMALLHKDELWMMTNGSRVIADAKKLLDWTERRANDEPLEYITNRVSFYSQEFYIQAGALIPRPETELLIDAVLERVEKEAAITIVEVGVGSGIISILLARHLPNARLIAVDISPDALKVAAINIKAYGLQERIELRQSDLLASVDEKIDLLVSNPPYIARNAPLERNLDYEPDLALFGVL